MGSGASATNAAGAVLWRERYTPFGEKLLAPAANDNQASFTGHIDDAATGLTYMQARYYDPALGRFLSIDPVEFSAARPDMFNRYAYAANDPVNMIDPDGRITVYIGGAGDQNGSKIVEDYADQQQKMHPDRTIAYFGEHERESATAFINDQIASGNEQPVNIVGHSWGAATAVAVAKGVKGTVNTLVGVDPVGKPSMPGTTSAPRNVLNVVRVDNQGAGGMVGEIAEILGKVLGGVPDAFQEAPVQNFNDFGHETFGSAYEQDGFFGSAKEIVDDTYN